MEEDSTIILRKWKIDNLMDSNGCRNWKKDVEPPCIESKDVEPPCIESQDAVPSKDL